MNGSHSDGNKSGATPPRVAIVTGGGTGIGAAIAARLSAMGTAVAIVGRRQDRLAGCSSAITASGGECLALSEDLADPEAAVRIVKRVTDEWGRLDVLVNNAAYIRNLPLAEITVDELDLHYRTNLRAPILLAQQALPWLRKSGSGAIVNISSSSAQLQIPTQTMYASLKAGLEEATRVLAAELAPVGIRVNCIAPGPVDTEIHLLWAKDLETARIALKDAVPLGHIGQPDDIARWVDYLSRADETFITGAVIAVDGGQTLNGWKSSIGAAAATEEATAG